MKCPKCKSEMMVIDKVGMSRIYACKKCDPNLFNELEKFGQ